MLNEESQRMAATFSVQQVGNIHSGLLRGPFAACRINGRRLNPFRQCNAWLLVLLLSLATLHLPPTLALESSQLLLVSGSRKANDPLRWKRQSQRAAAETSDQEEERLLAVVGASSAYLPLPFISNPHDRHQKYDDTHTGNNHNNDKVILMDKKSPSSGSPFAYNHSRAQFDTRVVNVYDVAAQDQGYLHCRVQNQGHFEVAWIRQNDGKLLTVQEESFTTDGRFQISHRNVENDYVLLIKDVKLSDGGIYECQLSTDPPRSFLVTLNVIEFETRMTGSAEVLIGSVIWLQCEIKMPKAKQNPSSVIIRWYHNNSLIIPHVAEKYKVSPSKFSEVTSTLTGRLEITNADTTDSGEYSCRAPGAKQSFVVEVAGVEKAAAMVTGANVASGMIASRIPMTTTSAALLATLLATVHRLWSNST